MRSLDRSGFVASLLTSKRSRRMRVAMPLHVGVSQTGMMAVLAIRLKRMHLIHLGSKLRTLIRIMLKWPILQPVLSLPSIRVGSFKPFHRFSLGGYIVHLLILRHELVPLPMGFLVPAHISPKIQRMSFIRLTQVFRPDSYMIFI